MKLSMISGIAGAVVAAAVAFAPVGASQAQDAKATVEKRIAEMKKLGGSMGALTKMAKGEEPYDKAKATAAAETLKAGAAAMATWFPAGTVTPESRAKPEIWSNAAGFAAEIKAMNDAIPGLLAAAAAGEAAKLPAGMGPVGKTCGSCHEGFRGPPKS